MQTLALVLLFRSPALALADPPSDPLINFDSAKKKGRNDVSFDHQITLYRCSPQKNATGRSGEHKHQKGIGHGRPGPGRV